MTSKRIQPATNLNKKLAFLEISLRKACMDATSFDAKERQQVALLYSKLLTQKTRLSSLRTLEMSTKRRALKA
jgi:hypothetical protein